jgi:hypothetical protein
MHILFRCFARHILMLVTFGLHVLFHFIALRCVAFHFVAQVLVALHCIALHGSGMSEEQWRANDWYISE